MSKNKLYKTKPYGHVFGDTEGRVFDQDMRYFRGDGTLWRDPEAKESAAEKAQREAEEKADAKAESKRVADEAAAAKSAESNDAQLSAQLSTSSGKL